MIGLREDQQMKAQLVARINTLFPDLRGPSVVSGLAPRWAAQQPQNQPLRSARYTLGCLIAPRGASPLTTERLSARRGGSLEVTRAVACPASKAAG